MAVTVLVFGRIHGRDLSSGNSIKGYTVSVFFECPVTDFQDDTTPEPQLTVPIAGSVPAAEDGSFRIELRAPADPIEPILVRASSPDRSETVEQQIALADLDDEITFEVEGFRPFTIAPKPPEETERAYIRGRAIDSSGAPVNVGLGIVLFGVDEVQNGEPGPRRVIGVSRTQTGGYFTLPWVPDPFASVFATIAGGTPIPIRLEDGGRLPRTTVLVTDRLPEPTTADSSTPPRVPEPEDLTTNPAAFSQDLEGGCINLSMPDRTIEEFSYFTVVRTSEPEVSGFTTGERTTVPSNLLGELIAAAVTDQALSLRTVSTRQLENIRGLTLDVATADRLLRGDRPPGVQELARAAWLSEFDRAKDLLGASVVKTSSAGTPASARSVVDDEHPIRWDYNETRVYQAVTIAHGHILQFREVWRADGYSLGDLLSSLPLAPGQRRRVAIVDWDRRSQAIREETLEFEEELRSTLNRDRDIQEIVGSRLSEEIEAGSRNTTWGVAGGFGSGLISGAFGIFGGVAGGASGSETESFQDASRRFSAESMQNLRDRVTQRASSLRDQRATVVQSVAQGETWRAETEVIANYNRCHTLTIEHFQVLRHFVVTHELAHVRECLFVPFPLRAFDRARALRWRETLEIFLKERSLRPGFVALERIADSWEGWDFPESRYSEEAPDSLEGELRISFVLPRPRDDKDAQYQINEWRFYSPYIPQDTLELWVANMNARAARERDEYFRQNVAPEIAANLVNQLRFAYITSSGSTVDLTLDGTLVSRYAEGTPLYVTLRPAGGLPPIPREQITALQIRYEGELPPDARVIVHSGKLRYRTPHFTALLFNEPRILNDLRTGDPVTISTPVSRAESRNPRQEDLDLADGLVRHLNANLEFYLQAIWATLDSECRFILLDGMLIPGAGGLSVASVVENRVIGIAGNSLILPLAPGLRLDPSIDEKSAPLQDLYASNPPPPLHIAVPTRGVYAEAIQGNCTACEKIDDARYWRWTTAGMLAPPPIAEVTAERPTSTEPDLTPTPLPSPLVSIQNAPELPEPTTLSSVLALLGKPELFRDITGLAGTQANAQKAFNSVMTNLSAIGNDAAALAKQQLALPNTERMLDRLQSAVKDELLTPELAQEFAEEAIRAAIAQPKETDQLPTEDPKAKEAVKAASEAKQAELKLTTPTETVEAKFEDTETRIGAGPAVGAIHEEGLIEQDFIVDILRNFQKVSEPRTIISVRLIRFDDVKVIVNNLAKDPDSGVFPIEKVDKKLLSHSGDKYKIFRRLQITFPADTNDPSKVAGSGRLPVVAMIHGHAEHWSPNSTSNFPSYQGFRFLQDHLALNGIVSISIDTNAANFINSHLEMRAEMLLEGLDRLRALDSQKTSPLFGRLDFKKVGIMGHSKGGDAVVSAFIENKSRKENQQFGITAICSLAPPDMTGTAKIVGSSGDIRTFIPDRIPDFFFDGPNTLQDSRVSYLVVYGGLDGDVSGSDGALGSLGTGFRHYDRATCPKAMVFLHHCNHNRFNSEWKNDKTGKDEKLMDPDDAALTGRLLSPADHQKLIIDYVGGFFRWKLKKEEKLAGFFTGSITNSVHAEASFQWSFGEEVKDLEDMENATQGLITTRTVKDGTIGEFGKLTLGGVSQEFRTFHQTGVLAVNPNLAAPTPAVLQLKFAQPQNWSGYKWLMFRVTADFDLDSLNNIATGSLPEFEVLLGDNTPKTAQVDQSSFNPPMTRPVFHQLLAGGVRHNVTRLKLETVRVELTQFQGLDLKKINLLEIHPKSNFPKHLFFDSLQLVKEK